MNIFVKQITSLILFTGVLFGAYADPESNRNSQDRDEVVKKSHDRRDRQRPFYQRQKWGDRQCPFHQRQKWGDRQRLFHHQKLSDSQDYRIRHILWEFKRKDPQSFDKLMKLREAFDRKLREIVAQQIKERKNLQNLIQSYKNAQSVDEKSRIKAELQKIAEKNYNESIKMLEGKLKQLRENQGESIKRHLNKLLSSERKFDDHKEHHK